MTKSSSKVEAVVEELRRELALPELDRNSYASTQSLESAIVNCESAIEALREDRTDLAVEIFDAIVRRAIDEWELTSELATAVANCAQNLRG
jgi:hypothetical protein